MLQQHLNELNVQFREEKLWRSFKKVISSPGSKAGRNGNPSFCAPRLPDSLQFLELCYIAMGWLRGGTYDTVLSATTSELASANEISTLQTRIDESTLATTWNRELWNFTETKTFLGRILQRQVIKVQRAKPSLCRSVASTRSRRRGRVTSLLSLLFLALPVTGSPIELGFPDKEDTNAVLDLLERVARGLGQLCSKTFHTTIANNMFQLFLPGNISGPRSFEPSTLLLASFITTTLTVIHLNVCRSPNKGYLVGIFLVLSLLLGMFYSIDMSDLLFRYVMYGVNIGILACSAVYYCFEKVDSQYAPFLTDEVESEKLILDQFGCDQ
jgi:hypothetical protein